MSDKNPLSPNIWYEHPSTRESMRYHEQFFPIDVELATPGTAEDLWAIAANEPTINLFSNPSFETGDPPTGVTAVGAAISQSAAQTLYGSNSILVNPDNAVAGEGFYITVQEGIGIGESITASCYVRGVAGAGDARIRIYGVTSGTWLSTGATVSLAVNWLSRLVTTWTNSVTPENSLRIYVVTATQHTNDFYCDGMQVEVRPSVSTYCDGAQGLLYSWDGPSHASISRRRPPLRAVRGFVFNTTRDCYIAYGSDREVTSSSTIGRLVYAGTDWWKDNISLRRNISFINRLAGEQPHVVGELWGL